MPDDMGTVKVEGLCDCCLYAIVVYERDRVAQKVEHLHGIAIY